MKNATHVLVEGRYGNYYIPIEKFSYARWKTIPHETRILLYDEKTGEVCEDDSLIRTTIKGAEWMD